jgi:hypothetical protein
MPYFAFFMTFSRRGSVEPASSAIWEKIVMATNVTGLKHLRLVYLGILWRTRCFRKIRAQFRVC